MNLFYTIYMFNYKVFPPISTHDIFANFFFTPQIFIYLFWHLKSYKLGQPPLPR